MTTAFTVVLFVLLCTFVLAALGLTFLLWAYIIFAIIDR